MEDNRRSASNRGPINDILLACEEELGDRVYTYRDIASARDLVGKAYFVQFVSGLRIKVRLSRKRGDSEVSRLKDQVEETGLVRFPKVLIQRPDWVALEWIQGRPLSEIGATDSVRRRIARFLSVIHTAEVRISSDKPGLIWREVGRKLEAKLPVLTSSEVISQAQSGNAMELYGRLSPGDFRISLIHGDLSPCNIVLFQNEIYSVDNEHMRIHFLEYDLGGTVNMWDEWDSSGSDLYEAYSEYNPMGVPAVNMMFWTVFDLVYRTSYEISYAGRCNEFYRNRLVGALSKAG